MDPISLGFMLALQAGGMVTDWIATSNQARLAKMGNTLEQADISAQIQTARVQAADASVQSMKQLRMNLGTQMALQAARGGRTGTTSSFISANESVGNFNADERIRKINELSEENSLRGKGLISNLESQGANNKLWNSFRSRITNTVSTNPSAWGQIAKGFSPSNKNGYQIRDSNGLTSSFGMTRVGAG